MNKKFFVIAFLFSNLASAKTPPWSILDEATNKDDRDRFLSYQVYQGRDVEYCISFGDNNISQANKKAIETEINYAMKTWLEAASYYKVSDVIDNKNKIINFKDVKVNYLGICDLKEKSSSVLSFIIDDKKLEAFGPGGFRHKIDKTDSEFSIIGDRPRIRTNNVKSIYELLKLSDETQHKKILADLARKSREKGYASKDFVKDYGLQSETIPFFIVMIHEIGHAFGVGDEYIGFINTMFKELPHKKSRYSHTSIMGGDALFYQTCDDVTGLTYLFDAYAGVQKDRWSICSFEDEKPNYEATYLTKTWNQCVSKTPKGEQYEIYEKYNEGKLVYLRIKRKDKVILEGKPMDVESDKFYFFDEGKNSVELIRDKKCRIMAVNVNNKSYLE